ncbi:MAG: IS66 family transposase [Candidatus Excrementavichristensenella sp.]
MDKVIMPKAAYEALMEQISTLQATVERLQALLKEKDQIILNLNRARFGQSSEKRTYLLSDGQLSMFEQAGEGIKEKATEEAPAAEKKEVAVGAHTRKPKRSMEGLTGKADIRRPAAPAPLLPHSYASASVVTDIIVKKYADALPLYRQEQMWKRLKVDLKRSTMANWVIQTAETYLKPFNEAYRQELLRQPVIHADETVLQVNKEPGRDATAGSRIWAYASSKRAERQIRYFRYEESRKGACAGKTLGGYTGVVVSDGYSGYNVLNGTIRAGCWAHARRKWVEAMPKGVTQENALAAKGLDYCSKLFEVEQKLENLSDAERREQRRLQSRPIVEAYYAWLQAIFKPTGKLKKAITYSLNQREYLCAFLDHGEIEISNNQVENAIRPIVVGRKNWLFCDTQAGAEASVMIFTMLETAKANGLNPETYPNHILTVLPDRFAQDPKAPIDDLLPWAADIHRQFAL